MAGLSASEVAILLKAQDQASPVIQKVSGELNKLGDAGTGLGSKLKTAGDAIAGMAAGAAVAGIAGLGAAMASSVKTAMDFEHQLSAIGAVSGATAQQMEQISKVALQLGKDTSFSALEAARAMEEMIKAGMPLEAALQGGAKAALDLAAATGTKVPEAAEIMANAMNLFNIEGSKAGAVADLLTQAANASSTSVHELGYSLAAGGTAAKAMGISLDDTITAFALFAKAGLKGSDAGTSFKTAMLNLTPASKEARAAMKTLGIITANGANQFFDAAGNAKSLSDIAQILKTSLSGLTKEQQVLALKTMFGTDAFRAMLLLMEAGSEGVASMKSEMAASGDAADSAAKRLDNLKGSLEKFWGSVETGAILLGGLLTPTLKRTVDTLTGFVNQGIDVIEQLPDAWRTVGQVFQDAWSPDDTINPITNAIGLMAIAVRDQLMPTVQLVGPVVEAAFSWMLANQTEIIGALIGIGVALAGLAIGATVVSAINLVGAAILALLSPVGVLIVAAAALGAAWAGNWGGIQEKTAAAWAVIQPILAQLWDWLGTRLTTVVNDLAVAWQQGWGAVASVLAQAGSDILAQLAKWGQAFVEWVTPYVAPMLEKLGALLAALGTWIVDTALPAIMTQLLAWGTAFVEWVGPQIPPLLAALGTLAAALLAWANEQIPPLVAQLLLWGKEFVAWVAPQIPPLLAALGKLWVQMQEWVIAQVPGIVAFLTKWGILFGAWVLTTAIPELLKNLPKIIVEIARWALSVHAEIARLTIKLGMAIVEGIWQGFQQAWPTIWERMKATLSGLSLSIPIRTSGSGNSSLQFRAMGGPVSAGSPYIVGERGPELFVPNQSGRIETMAAVPSLAGAGLSPSPVAQMAGGDTYNFYGVVPETVLSEAEYRRRTNSSLRGNRRW